MQELEFYMMLHHDFLTQASLILGRKRSLTVEFAPSEKEIRERYISLLLKAAQVRKFIRKIKERNGFISNSMVL